MFVLSCPIKLDRELHYKAKAIQSFYITKLYAFPLCFNVYFVGGQ